jgi:uncharacterized protein (TIGR03000 family)
MDDMPLEGEIPDGELPDPGAAGDTTPDANGSALLNVRVPEGAKVFVNGRPTLSTGDRRQYVSRGLASGFTYTYEIRAEAEVDGQTVQDTKVIRLEAGDRIDLAFDLKSQPETSLTLRVPEDATVTLAGNPTSATGDVRVFRTTSLAAGEEWSNYVIRVTVDRDGEMLAREETIALKAGEARELTFDFEAPQVASAR